MVKMLNFTLYVTTIKNIHKKQEINEQNMFLKRIWKTDFYHIDKV